LHDDAREELIGVVDEWDRAMVENDAEAIGRYMADDWTIIVRQDKQWRCVLTHLSRLQEKRSP
jgi:ketosteroid isomerase-like protein